MVLLGLRLILRLLEDLRDLLTASKRRLRILIEIAREFRKSRKFAVLSEVELELPRNRFHGLRLRGRADARDRDADIDGRTDTLEEESRRQVDLPVRNRDEIRRDVCRDVARLRFDDGQRRDRPAALLIRKLRRAFEQPRVQKKNIARIRLAPRRSPQEQRDFAVSDRVLREVVVDDEDVFVLVHQLFGHRAPRVRSDVLERRRVRR